MHLVQGLLPLPSSELTRDATTGSQKSAR
jgi:hypothetical protein